ncbi:hypothetical protein CDAR_88501 [Caerostris darwini]|uniref:Uncharacterized protein n=1 Tax=Caerostris darwini TaxID=1538125 RepID=A0AAV4Q4T5_9ARAC|nr:hypothetical protein CDAR_88501 [Caerostris darwini]
MTCDLFLERKKDINKRHLGGSELSYSIEFKALRSVWLKVCVEDGINNSFGGEKKLLYSDMSAAERGSDIEIRVRFAFLFLQQCKQKGDQLQSFSKQTVLLDCLVLSIHFWRRAPSRILIRGKVGDLNT